MTRTPYRPETPSTRVTKVLGRWFSKVTAANVLKWGLKRAEMSLSDLERKGLDTEFIEHLMFGAALFAEGDRADKVRADLMALVGGAAVPVKLRKETIAIDSEQAVVVARARAREMPATIGFDRTEQIKIVTAVSELARNVFRYAGGGTVLLEPTAAGKGLKITAEDEGPGIDNLDEILGGRYHSRTGLGLGLLGCKRLMDTFEIDSRPGEGTRVSVSKCLRTR